MKQLKGPSSHLAHNHLAPGEFFKWQGAYGAFSVAERDPGIVRHCIVHQREHHRIGRLNATLGRTFTPEPSAKADIA